MSNDECVMVNEGYLTYITPKEELVYFSYLLLMMTSTSLRIIHSSLLINHYHTDK